MGTPASLPRQPDNAQFAADAVYEHLRDEILSGSIRPNRRLVEETLAATLQVSRTPVREALLRLATEGLVTRARGWIVRDHAPEEVLRIIEARAAVESAAARLAAERITDPELHRLAEIIAEIEQPGNSRARLNELNKEFHGIITAASGNYLLVQFAQRTNISYWTFSMTSLLSAEDNSVANAQHRLLLRALSNRDADACYTLVWEHIAHTRSVLAEAFDAR